MKTTFAFILGLGPILFGIGFMAPVIAALIAALDMQPPFGVQPILVGLLIGASWGLVARWRGTWLW